MEVAGILNTNSLNLKGHSKADNIRSGKFQQMLEKSIDQDDKKNNASFHKKTIDKKLMDVCVEMESVFVSKMLKEMRETLPKEKLIDGGFAEKIFEDMLYDEYALNLSKNSNLGLAKMLYEELSRK